MKIKVNAECRHKTAKLLVSSWPDMSAVIALKTRGTFQDSLSRTAVLIGSMIFCAVMTTTAQADGEIAKGEKVFKKCMACHSVADKTNKVGPYLLGVFGRKVATVEGYAYSDSMKEYAATGAVWDEAALNAYLENPKAIVTKTKMAFAGIKKEDERADLIAFLRSKM